MVILFTGCCDSDLCYTYCKTITCNCLTFRNKFQNKYDDSLKIVINTHGVTTLTNIKIPGNPTFSFRAVDDIQSEIDSLGHLEINTQKDLLFLYANAPIDKSPLWCPSGLPKESLIKNFYYVLFITAKNIKTDK